MNCQPRGLSATVKTASHVAYQRVSSPDTVSGHTRGQTQDAAAHCATETKERHTRGNRCNTQTPLTGPVRQLTLTAPGKRHSNSTPRRYIVTAHEQQKSGPTATSKPHVRRRRAGVPTDPHQKNTTRNKKTKNDTFRAASTTPITAQTAPATTQQDIHNNCCQGSDALHRKTPTAPRLPPLRWPLLHPFQRRHHACCKASSSRLDQLRRQHALLHLRVP